MVRTVILGCALALVPGLALAHPGGLNAEGCHNDRKRGGYHCHGATQAAARPAPVYLLDSGTPVRFANCTQARRAGAAPIRRGEPGYRPKLDRDGDGVACE